MYLSLTLDRNIKIELVKVVGNSVMCLNVVSLIKSYVI